MAVTLFFGMTKSGKSYRAKEDAKQKKRVVVFDYAQCFNGGDIVHLYNSNLTQSFKNLYDLFSRRKEFFIIVRPSRDVDDVKAFDMTCALATALGRLTPKGEDNLVFIIDEMDMICTASTQSRQLKLVINKGRHDNVDTWGIARIPQRIHSDARANASRIVSFQLTEHLALSAIGRITGGGQTLKEIASLSQYHYLEWDTSGKWMIKNPKGKITRTFDNAKNSNKRL